jgi:hypothetical protein
MPLLTLPPTREQTPKPISLRHRIELLRRIHAGDGMDLTERVIAMLILLYAQPLNRITRLTLDDITLDAQGQMLIRLGDPPAPVPAPFDAIINDYLAARPNLTTATNPNSTWLFPGRRAGQPLHPTSIRLRLSTLGIPNLPARSRALREMLLQAPRPSLPACSATPRARPKPSPPKPAPPGSTTPRGTTPATARRTQAAEPPWTGRA